MVNGVEQIMPIQYDGDPLYMDNFNQLISAVEGCLLQAMKTAEGYVEDFARSGSGSRFEFH
jgi:hypothetical protein